MIISQNEIEFKKINNELYICCSNCGKALIKLNHYDLFGNVGHQCVSGFALLANDIDSNVSRETLSKGGENNGNK